MKNKILFLLSAFSAFAAATPSPDDVVVAGGQYYVGTVFGQQDYAAHANITLNAFRIMRTEVTFRFLRRQTPAFTLSGLLNMPAAPVAETLLIKRESGFHDSGSRRITTIPGRLFFTGIRQGFISLNKLLMK